MKVILYLAGLISIITYSFWGMIKEEIGIGIFYIGNALFIYLILFYIYYNDKIDFIKFFLLELAIANLIKEILFEIQKFYPNFLGKYQVDPSKLTLPEALLIIIIPFIWYLKKIHDKHNRILERN